MRHFRNQSFHSANAMSASFDACVELATKGHAHPQLKSLVQMRNAHGWTMLTVLASRLSPKGVKRVLDTGADPVARNRNGLTALEQIEATPLSLSEPEYGRWMAARAEVIALLMHAENVARHRLEGGTSFADPMPARASPEQTRRKTSSMSA